MDLLVSLGSSLAFFYSVLSCIQAAAGNLWCRPLLSAAAAGRGSLSSSNSAGERSAFHDLIEEAEPQNFFDTCATLICVLLLGKVGVAISIKGLPGPPRAQSVSGRSPVPTRLEMLAESPCPHPTPDQHSCSWLLVASALQLLQLRAKARILRQLHRWVFAGQGGFQAKRLFL